MPISRDSNIKRFKKAYKSVKKQGGDISSKLNNKEESKMANYMWMDNPFDRKIDTIDKHMKLENKQNTMKNEEKTKVSFYHVHTRELKNIKNWDIYNTPQNIKERDILTGRQIDTEKTKGYIDRIKDNKVHVADNISGGLKILKFSDITKDYKPENETKIANLTLTGPSNVSVTTEPKEDKNIIGIIPSETSEPVKDQKISDKVNIENPLKIKKIQDFGDTTF